MRVTAILVTVLVAVVCVCGAGMASTSMEHGHEAMEKDSQTMDPIASGGGGMKHDAARHSPAMTPADHQAMPEKIHEGHESMPAMDHDAHGDAVKSHDHEAMMTKAEQEGPPVGVVEQLGAYIPEDVWFTDSEGQHVNLRDLVGDKPTILLPVYFSCPNVCHILQSSFARVLPLVNLTPGEDIQVISLSFDERDTVRSAANSKHNFAMALEGKFPPEYWHFLTGDKSNISRAMESVGFRFKRVDQDFAHPVVVIAIAPGGKIVRYLYGTDFLPFDVTMAATEAAEGKTGLSVKRMLSYCFNYDPEGRRYTFDLMRVAGVSILSFIAIMLIILFSVGRKKKRR